MLDPAKTREREELLKRIRDLDREIAANSFFKDPPTQMSIPTIRSQSNVVPLTPEPVAHSGLGDRPNSMARVRKKRARPIATKVLRRKPGPGAWPGALAIVRSG